MGAYRAKTLIPMCLQPIWNKFIDTAFAAGKIKSCRLSLQVDTSGVAIGRPGERC